MTNKGKKYKGSNSKYRGVTSSYQNSNRGRGIVWRCKVTLPNGKVITHIAKDERDAAIKADKVYLEYGMYDMLNILKPKA